MTYLFTLLQILTIPALSPLAIGVTRKLKAYMQNRRGASVLQPYRDLWKLLHKDEVLSEDASWIFRSAPLIIFATTLVIGAIIPLLSLTSHSVILGDFVVLVGLLALETFVLALAGIDTGSAFGGFGSSRQMMLAAFTEGGLVLSLFTLALISKTSDLFGIAAHMLTMPAAPLAAVILAAIAFIICMLAETTRYPFDNPATHLELTMIHEAMLLEYSGPRLALMEWAAANKYLIFITLGANLFVPFYIASAATLSALAIGFVAFSVKAFVACLGVAMLESSIAKLRIFRLPDMLFTAFILSVIAIGLAF